MKPIHFRSSEQVIRSSVREDMDRWKCPVFLRSQPRSGRSISSNWITVPRATGRRQGPGLRLGLDNLQEPASVIRSPQEPGRKNVTISPQPQCSNLGFRYFSIISVFPPSAICLPVITSSGEILHCKCCNKQDSARLWTVSPDPLYCAGAELGGGHLIRDFIFRYLPFVDLDISKEIIRTSQLVCR